MLIPSDEYEALLDHADAVSRETWSKLVGRDATATLHVIGTLIAAVEKQLAWDRDKVLGEVSDIADACTDDVH